MPRVCVQFVVVVFSDPTPSLFWNGSSCFCIQIEESQVIISKNKCISFSKDVVIS